MTSTSPNKRDTNETHARIRVNNVFTAVQKHLPYQESAADSAGHWNVLVGEFYDKYKGSSDPVRYAVVVNRRFWPNWSDSTHHDDSLHRDVRELVMSIQDTAPAPTAGWLVTNLRTKTELFVQKDSTFAMWVEPADFLLLKIEPAYGYPVANGDEMAWNNGRRVEYSGKYIATYGRGHHVYLTKGSSYGEATEPQRAFQADRRVDTLVDSAKHPSIRARLSQVAIVYEGLKDTTTRIRIAIFDTAGTRILDSLVRQYRTSASFEATPVICPFKKIWNSGADSAVGWFIAWSEGGNGVGMRTYETINTVAGPGFGPIVYTNASGQFGYTTFPTTIERSVGEDSLELAFQEPDVTNQQIWFRRVILSLAANRISPGFRVPAECVSCGSHAQCGNSHPSIDVSHTIQYGYVPRVSWDGPNDLPLAPFPTSISTGFPGMGTFIYTASRIDSNFTSPIGVGWTNFLWLTSTDRDEHLPSTRVYATDSILIKFDYYDPFFGWTHISFYFPMQQPSQIGWYTGTKRLIQARGYEGLIWQRTTNNQTILMPSIWQMTHWQDFGMFPSLELNGRTKDDFLNQRALYLAQDGAHVRLACEKSFTQDTVVFFSTVQTYSLNCHVPPISANATTVLRLRVNDTLRPIGLFSAKDALYPGRVMHSDTIRPTATSDTLKYAMVISSSDTVGMAQWLGASGRIRYTLALRSKATNSVLRIIDTVSVSSTSLASRSDSGTVILANLVDSLIYVSLTSDTFHVSGAGITGQAVIQGYRTVSGGGFGKQAMHEFGRQGLVPEEVNPIALQIFPNPFNPVTSVSFQVPVEDADDVAMVKVYDMLVNDVSTLVSDVRPAGHQQIAFDGSRLPAGRYIVAVHLKNHQQSKLIILTR